MGRKGHYGPYKPKTDAGANRTRTEEAVVQAALEFEGWFTFRDLYHIAHHATVSVVLNRLARAGDLETRRLYRTQTKQFRWVNT